MVHESVHESVLFKQDQAKQIKIVIRNAIVVSLQYAQNQRGKRFKSSWCMVHESVYESVLFKQDQAKQIKIVIRNAIVVSLQYAQNQRGKRFKSSWCMVHESVYESVLFKQDQAKQIKIVIRKVIYAQNQHGNQQGLQIQCSDRSPKCRNIITSSSEGTSGSLHCKLQHFNKIH